MQLRRAWTLTSLLSAACMLVTACGPSAPAQPQPTTASAATTVAGGTPAAQTPPTAPPAPSPTTAAPTKVPATATPAATPTTAPSPTPAASPTPSAVRRTLQAAAVYTDDQGHPQGDLQPFTISVQPGPREQEFRLGFFETDVGQLGPIWRASGWMATAVGALETGKDVNSLRVSWETNGRIDGPSAGGLMTVAFVSAVLGDEPKTDVAFTGTINPDGSIGPVGGISYKLDAVIKQGLKTFLIPIGQRYDQDLESGDTVDVIQKGQLAGVTVKEVATFDEAYEQITGKTLPSTSAPSRAPDLSTDTYDRMRPKVLEWAAEYTDAIGRFKSVNPTYQDVFAQDYENADAAYNEASKQLSQGNVSAAYLNIRSATYRAVSLANVARLYETIADTSDYGAAQSYLEQSAGASRVGALIERLKAYQPSSPDDAILNVDAWSSTLWAIAIRGAALDELSYASQSSDTDEQWNHLFAAAWLLPREKLVAREAEDVLSFNFGRGQSSSQKVDPKALESWAGVFTRAAEANVTYFDSLILDQVAQDAGIRTEEIKARFAANDFDYVVATFGASDGAQQYLEKNIGTGPSRSYAQLGFALASYISSSSLVAQYYSLDARTDDNGNVVSIGRDRAMSAMLDAASDRSKERIAALGKSGGDGSLAILLYQTGQAERENGSPGEKLFSLRSFWTASTYARLQALMARSQS